MSIKRRRSIRRDYQRKKLNNPFFYKKKGIVRSSKRLKYILSILVLLIIGAVWFFFFCSVWEIREIKVNNAERSSSDSIRDIVYQQENRNKLGFLKQNNIFLLDRKKIVKEIKKDKNVFSVKIRRKMPHTIKVDINERQYAFIFQEKNNYYYISDDAYILKKVDQDNLDGQYLIIENRGNSLINGNMVNIDKKYLDFIFKLDKDDKNNQSIDFKRYIIDNEFYTIKAQVKDGPLVLFNIRNDVDKQFNLLGLVKKDKMKDNDNNEFKAIKHIDLRYGQGQNSQKVYLDK